MSGLDRPLRPPLAKSAEGPVGAFGALLSSAVADPATARGLALAYTSLETRHRLQIVDAIVSDCEGEGIGASAVLASLLSVEEDVEVARYIAGAMSAAGDQDVRTDLRMRTWLAGDELDGGVVLVRPLHGPFVEVLGLAWQVNAGLTHAIFEPFDKSAGTLQPGLGLPSHLRFEEMPVAYAIDTVTGVLWNHLRLRGELPECVQRFADLFWIERTPEPSGAR